MLLRNARIADALVDISLVDGFIDQIVPAGSSSADSLDAAEQVDLVGRWVMPGLWDHHTHFDQWAQRSARLDVSGQTSASQTAALIGSTIRAPKASRMDASVFVAVGFRDGLWPDAPSRELLDAASAAPIVVVSGDLHAAWLNSSALALFGHPTHPTGLLREGAAFDVVGRLDASSEEQLDDLAARAISRAAERGVVGIVDYEMADNGPKWHRRALKQPLGLRVEFGIYREHLELAIERGYHTGDLLGGSDHLSVGNLKIIIDGSLNTRTAYCCDPYPDLTDPAHGMLTVQPDDLQRVLQRAASAGIAASVHAIGDRANTIALDAFERLDVRLTGNRIEHAQLIAHADVARFAYLGVAASVQPDHAMDDRDVADRYWPGRTERAFPLRSLLDAHATLLFGSDAPVSPLDPMRTIAAAVSRTRGEREPWHPEQAISAAQAIAASTRSSIAVGQVADLVAVDANPRSLGGMGIPVPSVAATLLAGEFTYRDTAVS